MVMMTNVVLLLKWTNRFITGQSIKPKIVPEWRRLYAFYLLRRCIVTAWSTIGCNVCIVGLLYWIGPYESGCLTERTERERAPRLRHCVPF